MPRCKYIYDQQLRVDNSNAAMVRLFLGLLPLTHPESGNGTACICIVRWPRDAEPVGTIQVDVEHNRVGVADAILADDRHGGFGWTLRQFYVRPKR